MDISDQLFKDGIDMGQSVFLKVNIDLSTATAQQRQTLAAFVFGMLYADGHAKNLSAKTIHDVLIEILCDLFEYSKHEAEGLSEFLISAASDKKVHNVINAIIHRGIDGHAQWQMDNQKALKENVNEILALVCG